MISNLLEDIVDVAAASLPANASSQLGLSALYFEAFLR